MADELNGKVVAILATDGFEQSELHGPMDALEEAGARVDIVSLQAGVIQGFQHLTRNGKVSVDCTLDEVCAADYDALVLPGGLFNPDALRADERAVRFVRGFFDERKPVGAICHGSSTLINADVVKGRTMTSVKSVRKDLENAGAHVVDADVVVDHGLVTSRTQADLVAFCSKLVEEIGNRQRIAWMRETRPGHDPACSTARLDQVSVSSSSGLPS